MDLKMKRLISLLTAAYIAVFFSLIPTGCEKQSGIEAKLDEFMSAFNKYSSYKYSGVILVAKGDEILLNKGYGMADYQKKLPNTPESVFAIGSITKSFTAACIMQLQEKGMLNVNDPVSKYIDGNSRGDDITIHHLLTHTSGLPRDGKYSGTLEVPLEENVSYISKYTLLFEPGEDHMYSNAGYQLLAAIIEKVSGKSYSDYINENIFVPLGMDTSRCGVDASYADDQSIGYKIETGEPVRQSIYNFSCITGSGNIYSTAEDLYKYDRGLYDKLLTEESLSKIFSPQFGNWKNGYGYGWEITERNGHKKISHGGNIGGGGYVSLMIKYPEDDYVLIFLTNNSDTTALYTVSESMEAIIFDEEYVIPEKTGVKVDSEVLKQYTGEYSLGKNIIIPVSYEDGKLYTTADDGNTYELLPISKYRFCFEDHQWITYEFVMDKDNNTVILKARNASRGFEGKKVK